MKEVNKMQGLLLSTQSLGSYGGLAVAFLSLAVLAAAIRVGYLYAAGRTEHARGHRAA